MADNGLRLVEMDETDKSKALEAALAQIERAHGKGFDHESLAKARWSRLNLSPPGLSGSISRSASAGCRAAGWSKSTVPESSGKTTLALHCVAEVQKAGGQCAFIDAEHALDPGYAKKLGVNVADLLISQPDAGEQALEIADTLVRSGAIDIIVID